ncbi:glycosyltransferase [Psychromonas ossibalaenae]|uniref:glycosyltransferase n=1 Tax=Psychromonas ossibalaenae TaxID=444922 RepID=UPI00037C0A6D|nr:glycosyltransferase family 2 protein [Psychromonas ossibalaenae]
MQLSVIIPTRNRADALIGALQSLTQQTFSQDLFEVIVVDNGSTDNTKEVVSSFNAQIKNLIYIYDPTPGLHIGRHRGLLASRANILVYGDDDIKAFPTWLEAINDTFLDQEVVLVGGKNLPDFEVTPPDWIEEQWLKGGNKKVLGTLSLLDFGDEQIEISPLYVFGCNFSIRKNVLLEAGGFHPDGMPQELIKYRGDGETTVSQYVRRKGYKTVFNPKASVFHLASKNRLTQEYFSQRAFNQAISDSYTAIRENKPIHLLKKQLKLFIKKYILCKGVETETAYIKGYVFHQKEVKADKCLLSWIKRDSYIENGDINA